MVNTSYANLLVLREYFRCQEPAFSKTQIVLKSLLDGLGHQVRTNKGNFGLQNYAVIALKQGQGSMPMTRPNHSIAPEAHVLVAFNILQA